MVEEGRLALSSNQPLGWSSSPCREGQLLWKQNPAAGAHLSASTRARLSLHLNIPVSGEGGGKGKRPVWPEETPGGV